jgi:hypothetical protein
VSTQTTTSTRPTVEQVASLIRARTKDSNGLEVGTFDSDTRPTADQVEQLIDQSVAIVAMQLPPSIPADLAASAAAVVALDAACRVEKSFWPEQVQSDRSPYALLKTEYDEALAALKVAVEAGGTAGFGRDEVTMLPIGSWTSMPRSFIFHPDTGPAYIPPPPVVTPLEAEAEDAGGA